MVAKNGTKAERKLDPKYLWIIAFPSGVLLATFALISFWGWPHGKLDATAALNGHAEAAGRITMLATWFLLVAVAIPPFFLFFGDVTTVDRDTARRVKRLYWLFAVLGVAFVAAGLVIGAQRFMGEGIFCQAFASVGGAVGPLPSERAHGLLDLAPDCTEGRYLLLWVLNELQKVILALMTPALVLGTILCLAPDGGRGGAATPRQLARLKTYLYLSAAALVTGLLFLSAMLRWPSTAFGGSDSPYMAHANAVVLYWGATYSVLIASYYLPVALTLRRGQEGEDGPSGHFLEFLKSGTALFAPVITALLSAVVQV